VVRRWFDCIVDAIGTPWPVVDYVYDWQLLFVVVTPLLLLLLLLIYVVGTLWRYVITVVVVRTVVIVVDYCWWRWRWLQTIVVVTCWLCYCCWLLICYLLLLLPLAYIYYRWFITLVTPLPVLVIVVHCGCCWLRCELHWWLVLVVLLLVLVTYYVIVMFPNWVIVVRLVVGDCFGYLLPIDDLVLLTVLLTRCSIVIVGVTTVEPDLLLLFIVGVVCCWLLLRCSGDGTQTVFYVVGWWIYWTVGVDCCWRLLIVLLVVDGIVPWRLLCLLRCIEHCDCCWLWWLIVTGVIYCYRWHWFTTVDCLCCTLLLLLLWPRWPGCWPQLLCWPIVMTLTWLTLFVITHDCSWWFYLVVFIVVWTLRWLRLSPDWEPCWWLERCIVDCPIMVMTLLYICCCSNLIGPFWCWFVEPNLSCYDCIYNCLVWLRLLTLIVERYGGWYVTVYCYLGVLWYGGDLRYGGALTVIWWRRCCCSVDGWTLLYCYPLLIYCLVLVELRPGTPLLLLNVDCCWRCVVGWTVRCCYCCYCCCWYIWLLIALVTMVVPLLMIVNVLLPYCDLVVVIGVVDRCWLLLPLLLAVALWLPGIGVLLNYCVIVVVVIVFGERLLLIDVVDWTVVTIVLIVGTIVVIGIDCWWLLTLLLGLLNCYCVNVTLLYSDLLLIVVIVDCVGVLYWTVVTVERCDWFGYWFVTLLPWLLTWRCVLLIWYCACIVIGDDVVLVERVNGYLVDNCLTWWENLLLGDCYWEPVGEPGWPFVMIVIIIRRILTYCVSIVTVLVFVAIVVVVTLLVRTLHCCYCWTVRLNLYCCCYWCWLLVLNVGRWLYCYWLFCCCCWSIDDPVLLLLLRTWRRLPVNYCWVIPNYWPGIVEYVHYCCYCCQAVLLRCWNCCWIGIVGMTVEPRLLLMIVLPELAYWRVVTLTRYCCCCDLTCGLCCWLTVVITRPLLPLIPVMQVLPIVDPRWTGDEPDPVDCYDGVVVDLVLLRTRWDPPRYCAQLVMTVVDWQTFGYRHCRYVVVVDCYCCPDICWLLLLPLLMLRLCCCWLLLLLMWWWRYDDLNCYGADGDLCWPVLIDAVIDGDCICCVILIDPIDWLCCYWWCDDVVTVTLITVEVVNCDCCCYYVLGIVVDGWPIVDYLVDGVLLMILVTLLLLTFWWWLLLLIDLLIVGGLWLEFVDCENWWRWLLRWPCVVDC